jgi:ABC-type antimicrobial peptide transport system permease subunit
MNDVVLMFVGEGLVTAGTGVAIGLPVAVVVARYLESLLGVPPSDPATLAAVAGVLLATASIAGYLPARRASHIDPLGALRAE